LRITVHEQYSLLGGCEACGKIDGSGGFAHAALLIRDCNDFSQLVS
jgi:hypothetical protein